MNLTKSRAIYEEAKKIIPGPHSNLPGWEIMKPVYISHGKGAHVYDVDGNDYIDYICGVGAGILGYGNKKFLDICKKQMDKMYYLDNFRRNPLEIELAKKLVEHVPSAEKVRFLLSGSEAVQLAIRLARAFTGRSLFIRFDGHYHGWLDNVLGGKAATSISSLPYAIDAPEDRLYTQGRAPDSFKESFKIPWNDIEFLEAVLEKYGEQVATIIMEPINCNGGTCWPRTGYLEKVRKLCDKFGIVLCFDEIITGFRTGLGGAQKMLGVTPDLCTFGKAIASGIPFSVVAGKAKIMDLLTQKKVVGAGTFNGYPFGMAAAIATIEILEENDGAFYKSLDEKQEILVSGLKEIAKRLGIKMLLQEARGCFFYQFVDLPVAYNIGEWYGCADHDRQLKFRKELIYKGVMLLVAGRWFINGSHTENDIEYTLNAVEEVLKKI